jgi:hypothetical protein
MADDADFAGGICPTTPLTAMIGLPRFGTSNASLPVIEAVIETRYLRVSATTGRESYVDR